MSELITEHSDSEKRVSATFHKNCMVDGDKKYATVKRNTATLENVIAVVKKNNPLVSETIIRMMATEFKIAILQKLREGEAVNVLDLGILYLNSHGGIDAQDPTVDDVPDLGLGFAPSKEAKSSVADVLVDSVATENTAPAIRQITDLFTERVGCEATEGMPVQISGERLRVAGDGIRTGVFFAPVMADGTVGSDEAAWVRATHVFQNMPKTISLILPPQLKAGSSWFVVIRTSSSHGKREVKSVREAVSALPLTVIPAVESALTA